MNEGRKWLKLFLTCLMAGSLALAGCSGDDGSAGTDGRSAFQIAQDNGLVPEGMTEAEWIESLQGANGGTDLVAPQTAETSQCITCHTTMSAASLQEFPFADEITERFVTSRHANQNARSGFCSACHSHEGGKVLLSMGRMTSRADLQAAYTADLAVFQLPVGSSTIVGVNKKTCSTCHTTSHFPLDPGPGLRGDGDVLASAATVAGFPAAAGTPVGPGNQAEVRVAYSAEFNLCTACHTVDLDATWNAAAGYGGRGMIEYTLSSAYTSANLVDAATGTFVMSNAPFYHDGASGNGRTFADTHFGGTIMEHLVKFNGSAADIEIKGYNINPGNADACTICHDPHTAGKMLSIDSSSTIDYADQLDNKVVSYAEGLGDFHTGYTKDALSRLQVGCTPCHTGEAFAKMTVGGTPAAERWNVIGCRSCHDLAVPNAVPNQNNSAAFAEVREFPATHTFAFNSGAVVPVAELGVNQVCFECHKGRTPGIDVAALAENAAGTMNYTISYLHYAPAFATLFGNESGMVATYPGKTYAGRFVHPVANAQGSFEFGCVDCHDVHNTDGNHVVANKMTNPEYSCSQCHSVGALSAANLQARTEAYSVRLLDTVYAAMITAANGGNPDAALNANLRAKLIEIFNAATVAEGKALLIDYIEARQAFFPNKAIAHAATTWKVFTYEDGAVHGHDGVHGHGGSWAHNSVFARQMMFDAIESLGGNLTGLARP